MSRPELQALYGKRAKRYDLTANLFYLIGFREWAFRQKAVAALRLEHGDSVVEIGCGTGINFSLLHKAVGPKGRLIGVDMTDAMLSQAKSRIAKHGWKNVELVHSDAAEFQFPPRLGGIISTFALTLVPEFDAVIEDGAHALAPGKRLVVADLKFPRNWAGRLAPLLMPMFRPFGATLDLADRHPWESIERYLDDVRMEERMFGYVYIASGRAAFAQAVGDHTFPNFSLFPSTSHGA